MSDLKNTPMQEAEMTANSRPPTASLLLKIAAIVGLIFSMGLSFLNGLSETHGLAELLGYSLTPLLLSLLVMIVLLIFKKAKTPKSFYVVLLMVSLLNLLGQLSRVANRVAMKTRYHSSLSEQP